MEDILIQKMRGFVIILVIAICGFGIVNTAVLLHRIQELDSKIEAIKTRTK